jgi:molecular chaperone DnaJ
MRLRLTGEGEGGTLGGPPGDLYVVLAIERHELFEREGADLHLQLPISVFQAMLGATIEVKTILDEERSIEVAPGSQPDDVIRVRGAGVPQVDTHRRGDLYVHLRVVVPDRLSSEQRQLVAEAARLSEGEVEGGQRGLFDRLKRALGTDER